MAQERTLPMLLLNLGGEMVYILEQRLQAQKVAGDKANKVLVDICRLLLHDRFMAELLVPQPLGHTAALRSFFRDLAHSSIMRLDDDSMAKMWDLMTMAVKLQALRADSPEELLQATMNHIDYIGDHVSAVRTQAEQARQALFTFYSRMPSGELQAVRYCILNYLQGLAVRVSLFLKHGLQDMHGRLIVPKDGPVPPGCEVPGTIRVMDGGGREVDSVVHVVHFPSGGVGACTELGFNLYSEFEEPGSGCVGPAARQRRRSSLAGASSSSSSGRFTDAQGRPLHVGREELNMLMAQLLGNRPYGTAPGARGGDVPTRLICVSLFNSGEPEQYDEAGHSTSTAGSAAAAGLAVTAVDASGGGTSASSAGPSTSSTAAARRRPSVNASMLSIDASGSAGSRSASLRQILSDMNDDGDPVASDTDEDAVGGGSPSSDSTAVAAGRRGSTTTATSVAVSPSLLDLWDALDEVADEEDDERRAEQRPLL